MINGKKGLVLIIEDEKKISDILKSYLEREGYSVRAFGTGREGLSALKEGPSLIVLDLMLPDMDGEDICKTIRKDSDVPILMLTAKSGEEDRIRGLGIGADDYVVKPFSPREVAARVNALLRRTSRGKRDVLSFNNGALNINKTSTEVFLNDRRIDLTSTEYRILTALAQRPGIILSRDQLVNAVQGYDFEGYDRTIDAHIKNLRHKIDPDVKNPALIRTVYGMGYKFIGRPDED